MYAVFVATAIAVLFLACAGWQKRSRPEGVPKGAVPVTFSKEGGWAYCWLDRTINLNRCRTYNADGKRLYRPGHESDDDDVFLRYQGAGPVPESELEIDRGRTAPDYIWLKNGVVLLPRNAFEVEREWIDKLMEARRRREASEHGRDR
jgi:hypothetical protein